MAVTSTTNNATHILVFPFPAQGHMLPLLDLSHQLVRRGLTLTIVVTPKNLPILTPLLSKHPSIQTLVLPFPTQQSYIPPGVENVKDLPSTYFGLMIYVMGKLHDPLLHWFRTQSSRAPTAILSDFFLGWTHHLASQLGIPRIVFSPSGALVFSIGSEVLSDVPKYDDPHTSPDALFSFPKVPNSPVFPRWQLSPLIRECSEEYPNWEFIRDGFVANLASWGFVFNSFDELERVYLEHMVKAVGIPRVWSVGPLMEDVSSARGGSTTDGDILSWLETCDDHSIVFICFGSQVVLLNKQMEAVAAGLERSGVRFVWATKVPTVGHVEGDYGVMPSGFEERLAGKGVVIRGWVPQVLILRHRAVGGFLTHCGWNSVLESVVAGVPMLAWPMGADQYVNAMLLVDQMGVATRVCEGAETIPNATELAQAFVDVVSVNYEKRERAVTLSKAALSAVNEGGSSFMDLDRLMRDLESNSTRV